MLRLILGTPRRITQQANQHDDDTNHQSNHNEDDQDESGDDVDSRTTNGSGVEHLMELPDHEILEPWPDFIKRATHIADTLLEKFEIEDWLS
eukprot:10389592-Karenia_brevis.AAC.1